jgi:hypothetical protein
MSTNRREFLQRSGGLALTGFIGASGIAAASNEIIQGKPGAAPAKSGSVESWLLETGRSHVDDSVYHAVCDGKC